MNQWSDFDDMVFPSGHEYCAVMRFILSLPEEGQLAIDRALASGRSIPAIRGALRKIRPGEGIPCAESWRLHRTGQCCCKAV